MKQFVALARARSRENEFRLSSKRTNCTLVSPSTCSSKGSFRKIIGATVRRLNRR